MKNLKIPFLGLVLLSLVWITCLKDFFTGMVSEPTTFVTFSGQVMDENKQSIAGTRVEAEGRSASTTDHNGVFRPAGQTLPAFIQYDLDGESFSLLEPIGFSIETHAFIAAGDSLHNQGTINFCFQNDGQVGSFPVKYLWLKKYAADSLQNLLINTTVTEFGSPGQAIAGSFSGTYQTLSNGVTHHITGSYQVRRQ